MIAQGKRTQTVAAAQAEAEAIKVCCPSPFGLIEVVNNLVWFVADWCS